MKALKITDYDGLGETWNTAKEFTVDMNKVETVMQCGTPTHWLGNERIVLKSHFDTLENAGKFNVKP